MVNGDDYDDHGDYDDVNDDVDVLHYYTGEEGREGIVQN